jgi:hypothetical protein
MSAPVSRRVISYSDFVVSKAATTGRVGSWCASVSRSRF